jgi:hypothetical protein
MMGPEFAHRMMFPWFPIIPLLILVATAILACVIAGRKGQNQILFAILGLIPVVNVLSLIWLLSITDKAVYDQLDEIGRRLPRAP